LDVAADHVLIAPGCKMALSLAMMALIEHGDEVLYPDPGFPSIRHLPAAWAPPPSPLLGREESISARHCRNRSKNHTTHQGADF